MWEGVDNQFYDANQSWQVGQITRILLIQKSNKAMIDLILMLRDNFASSHA